MTKEEKEIVLEALERGRIAGKNGSYFENGRWKSVPRLVERAIKIMKQIDVEVSE